MKHIRTILILLFVYLIVAVPFKVMEIIPGFTDIRPVIMLEPVYAVFFGIPGCIVMALGNLVMDAVSDSLRWSSIMGFVANFSGPLLIWAYWHFWSPCSFSLRNGRNILRHIWIVFLSAILEMALITPSVALFYPEIDAKLFALSILLNNFLFPIIFGIPLIILIQEEMGFIPQKRAKGNE